MQYFYIVAHTTADDNQIIDKVFLQERDAIKWGRTLASRNSSYSVSLYKQEIARTAIVKFVKQLEKYSMPIKNSAWTRKELNQFINFAKKNDLTDRSFEEVLNIYTDTNEHVVQQLSNFLLTIILKL